MITVIINRSAPDLEKMDVFAYAHGLRNPMADKWICELVQMNLLHFPGLQPFLQHSFTGQNTNSVCWFGIYARICC
jgi:hypothetical protein